MKPLWKVTFTTVSLHGLRCALLLGRRYEPHVEVRIYRWHWRARWAAFCAEFPAPGIPLLTQAKVESYWPNSNVVPLRRVA